MNLKDLTEKITAIRSADPCFDTETILELDEAACENHAAHAQYDRLGVAHALLSVESDGALSDMPGLMHLLRAVCRKDIGTGASHILGAFMAATNVWVAGSAEQKQRFAARVRDGRTMSVACRGFDHAEDPVSGGLTATRVAQGYVLSGAMPLLSNVARDAAVILQARSAREQDKQSHSLFFIELDEIDRKRYEILPCVRTQGMRGCQTAGIRFQDCFIPEQSLLGEECVGSTYARKASQIVQVLVSGASIGNIEYATDLVVRYAGKRNLYGATVLDLPHARTLLTETALEIYLADSLCRAAAGAFHVVPGETRSLSAVCEFLVPQRMRAVLKRLALLLGSRHYLREGEAAPFEKILRDYSTISLMHANALACQTSIAEQLPWIFRGFHQRDIEKDGSINRLFQNDGLPPFEIGRLRVECQGADLVLQGLHHWPHALHELCASGRLDDTSCARLCGLIEDLKTRLERLTVEPFDKHSEACYDAVQQYAWIECASASIGRWINESHGPFAGDPSLLGACLEFVLGQLDGALYYPDITLVTSVITHLQHRVCETVAVTDTHSKENTHVASLH